MHLVLTLASALLIPTFAVAQQSKPVSGASTSISGARYQIVMSPLTARDTFLLHTETCKVWQLTSFGGVQGEPVAWNYMEKIDDSEKYFRFLRSVKKVSAQGRIFCSFSGGNHFGGSGFCHLSECHGENACSHPT